MAKPLTIAENFKDILEDISLGDSVDKACRKRKISKTTFFNYIDTDEKLKNQYTLATQRRGESAVDRIEQELEKLDLETTDPAKARIKIDTLKWLACKFYPKMYGDKVDQNVHHSGSVTMPVIELNGAELTFNIGDDVVN